ncbi:MAG: M28 family peptidase [Gammaproteobacteria bacterium]
MSRLIWRSAAAALLFSLSAHAAQPVDPNGTNNPVPAEVMATAAALRDQALHGTEAYATVRSLTTEVGPRMAGSSGDRAAVAWALTRLPDLGFKNVHAEPVTVPEWVRGDIAVSVTEPYPQTLAAVALGGSVGTPDEGIDAPVLSVDSLDALHKLKASEVAGKIVFFDKRMPRTRDGSGYGETVPVRVDGPAEAAKLGAAAVVIRSVGTDTNRLAHTGITKYQSGVPRIPAAALSNPDADLLEGELATGRPVSLHMKLTSRYLAPARSANVVGEIPGRGASSEIVLLGAHLDSWDLGTGAIDDGAGVAIVTEAARLIGNLRTPPRRTIRVVLYANEEFGVSGGKAYALAHKAEAAKHVLGMEADFGSGRVWQLAGNLPADKLELEHAMLKVLEPLGITLGENDSEGGADVGQMLKLGMPVLTPRQDGTSYFDYHHTANDTLDKVSRGGLDQNVGVYAALTWIAANIPDDFGRVPVDSGEEDKSAAPSAKPGASGKP